MSTPLSVLSPEARVLLGAVPVGLGLDGGASSGSGGPEPETARVPPAEDLDWERLYRLLIRERAAAALHPVPERLPVDPPPEWDERLRALGAVSGFRQRRLLDSLEAVVELLADRGITVCLLKGAALALTRYPDPLQRPMGDLDLLVERSRAEEAWEALREAGWTWDRERYPRELYDTRQHRPPLESPGPEGQFVEIHEDLFVDGNPFGLGPHELRRDSEPVQVGSAGAEAPGPTAHLAYTCLHFGWADTLGKNGWRTFRDAAVLGADPGFGGDAFVRLAGRSRAGRPCYWTLRLARRLGGVRVPDEVLSALRPDMLPSPAARALERHFALKLFAGEDEEGCPSVTLGRALWRAAVQPPRPGGSGGLPWQHDEGFRRLQAERGEEPESPPGSLRRLARHVSEAGRWARYLGSLIGWRATGEGPGS